MSAEQSKIRLLKKGEQESPSHASMPLSDLRIYLIERRRALLTELDALNRALNLEPQKTK